MKRIGSFIKAESADMFRRLCYERPSEAFRKQLEEHAESPCFHNDAKRLLRDGITILPKYFRGHQLQAIKDDFDKAARSLPISSKGEVSIRRNVLRDSEALSLSSVDPYLLRLAAYYWGKPVCLAEWSGKRLHPHQPGDYAAYQYHHDCKHKQVKVMILLTDVTDFGQRMDYVPKTHVQRRSFANYEDSRFTDAEALALGPAIHCAGPAGTAIIFDTNGLHRGNRNAGPVRDTITANYTAGHAQYLTDELHPSAVKALTGFDRRLLQARSFYPQFLLRRL